MIAIAFILSQLVSHHGCIDNQNRVVIKNGLRLFGLDPGDRANHRVGRSVPLALQKDGHLK